jgi:uncharacterized membrane protein
VDLHLDERNVLLVAHVAAAITLLGPVTLATSLFPRYATRELLPVARALFRVSRGYGFGSLLVPAIGLILAQRVGYDGMGWVNASLGIFVVAFLLLVALVVPRQQKVLRTLEGGEESAAPDVAMLRGTSGVYALSWLVILYLMVAKPF